MSGIGDDTFQRLHSDYEKQQRNKVRIESEYD